MLRCVQSSSWQGLVAHWTKVSEGLAARRMPASKTEQGQQQGHPAGCRQGRRSSPEIAQPQDLEVSGRLQIAVEAQQSRARPQLEV